MPPDPLDWLRRANRRRGRNVGGEERARLPLCLDCLTLLWEDVRVDWDGFPLCAEG